MPLCYGKVALFVLGESMNEDESVAVARRLRALLVRERDKLREYLCVLETQEKAIESEDAEAIRSHTAMGEGIVKSIAAIQKVATPLYAMLPPEKRAAVTQIAQLQSKVATQNKRNCELLRAHLTSAKSELNAVQSHPYMHRRSGYAASPTLGRLVEVEA